MDEIINIKVNGNSITKDYNVAGTQFEANRGKLRITFSENWNGYGKSITFWNALGENPVKIQLGTDKLEDITTSDNVYIVPIPGEAMTEGGKCSFVIEGATDGVNARTVEDTLKVLYSPKADNAGQAVDPTPTQAEQLRQEMDSFTADLATVLVAKGEIEMYRGETLTASINAQASAESASIASATAVESATIATEAKEAIENMTVSSEELDVGATPTVTKELLNGIVNLHFGLPIGDPGVFMGDSEPTDPSVDVWIDTSGEVDEVVTKREFVLHTSDFSNPHYVTAEQIGALTAESLNDEMGKYIPAIENDISALQEQMGDVESALDAILAIQRTIVGGGI